MSLFDCKDVNECIRHRMLNERDPRMIMLEDKYKAWQHAKKLGIAVPKLLAVGTDPKKVINFSKLPGSYVVKCNHWSGTGGIAVIRNGKDLCRGSKRWKEKDMQAMFGQCLKKRYNEHEWAVDNIKPPVIMIEEFLVGTSGGHIVCDDYKLYAFNGYVACIQAMRGRFSKKFSRAIYSRDWKRIMGSRDELPGQVARPKHLDQMIKWAERISLGLPFVRVDFYDTEKSAIFGECTMYPMRGYVTFPPDLSQELAKHWHNAAKELEKKKLGGKTKLDKAESGKAESDKAESDKAGSDKTGSEKPESES